MRGARSVISHRGMGNPIDETVETEVLLEGDVPDEEALDRRGLEAAPEPEEEPLVGSLEDVENGSVVGWSE